MTSIYHTLTEMINNQELKPNSRIKETELSTILQISRTPLRQALQQLERDNLIIKKAPRLRYIAPFSIMEMIHLSTCRQSLEGLVAMQATERYIDGASIDALLQKHQQIHETIVNNDTGNFQKLGLKFHVVLADIAQNTVAKSCLEMLNISFERYRRLNTLYQSRKQQIYYEHDAVIKAIQMKDPRAAREMMEFHIAAARVADLKSLQKI